MQHPAPTLEYRHPQVRPDVPSLVLAMFLCLPGMVCWCILLGLFFTPASLRPQFSLYRAIPSEMLLWCWGTAVIAALVSLGLYVRARKPWYVCINLAVNVAGLLFTGAAAPLLLLFLRL